MKLAFIGTGKIIADALHAVSPLEQVQRTAIFSRPHSREKAEALAAQYHMPEVYTDYQELLTKTEADTVYIGLINSAHYSYAKEALEAGKHVILEKPFTGFAKEAKELVELAEAKGLFILEAITVLHNTVFYEMKQQLPKLGPIKMVLANYSQYSSRYDNYLAGKVEHAFSREYYGGALFDINIYNVHYCVALFGKPEAVNYYPNLGPNGIDTSGTLVLSYPGFSAVCTGAKDSDSPGYVSVQGEQGWMKISSKPNIAAQLTTIYTDPDNKELVRDAAGAMVRATCEEDFRAPEQFHRMTQEFADFAAIIDTKDYTAARALAQESLQVIEVLEAGRKKAGIEF